MIEERRTQLTEWARPQLEAGEEVRAIVVCRERPRLTGGQIAGELLSGLATSGGGGGGTRRRLYALMATDRRIVAFPLEGEGLGDPLGSWPRGTGVVRVRRGLFGSTVQVGQTKFDLPPLTRGDAKRVAAAAAG